MTTQFSPIPAGWRFEESPRRVRTTLGSAVVADSQRMRLLYPPGSRPAAYYFPVEDVRMQFLAPSAHAAEHADLGATSYWDVSAGDERRERAARAYPQPPQQLAALSAFLTFDWNAMTAWFEEDEEIFVHPRDPYHRVDIRESSRHVRVEIDGRTVAETHRPRVLFETNHPVRYYIPRLDVREDLLRASETRTGCAYKGFAGYWSVATGDEIHQDIAWSYAFPFAECAKIATDVCFYNERVDTYVDGRLIERPVARAPRPL